LRGRFCQPISIRWHISFWTTRYSTHFRAVYSDLAGFIHEGECRVYRRLMDNPFFGSSQVEWLRDEVTGRTSAPEVYVDDEIIRRKLNPGEPFEPDESSESSDQPFE
jgi:hypothetical protein